MKLWYWLYFLFRPLLNERGAVGEGEGGDGGEGGGTGDGDGGTGDEGSGFVEDDFDPINLEEGEGGEGDDSGKVKDEGGKGDDDSGKKKAEDDPVARQITDLNARINRLENDKSDLKKALHQARQDKKQDKGEPLDDNQILAILNEHKDDPTVLLNTIKYVAKQHAAGAKKDAVDDVEISNQRRDLDNYCANMYGENWTNEDSTIRKNVVKARENFKLGDHPFGDFLGLAAGFFMNFPTIQKNIIEKAKADALKGKAEDAREGQIKDGSLPSGKKTGGGGGDKGKFGLTAAQIATAGKLGLKSDSQLKIYASQILKGKPAKKEG